MEDRPVIAPPSKRSAAAVASYQGPDFRPVPRYESLPAQRAPGPTKFRKEAPGDDRAYGEAPP
ncbi:hypothetical protein Sliba_53860 [Streptomyces nigrescens]|uniref:Uncharacterized protein n=1 Tax=Streptomyces nigrescens TaxID=1920 RepID=A0A640TLZ8_STRNI|nr:hypothetical protein Sliba_53860 [Streptomyces libani subsp. libani]GGV95699.1 hypothetical protein GCM10010500_36790 [Streptomyces libani subsp. libani]